MSLYWTMFIEVIPCFMYFILPYLLCSSVYFLFKDAFYFNVWCLTPFSRELYQYNALSKTRKQQKNNPNGDK
jgi:hypothetical protein